MTKKIHTFTHKKKSKKPLLLGVLLLSTLVGAAAGTLRRMKQNGQPLAAVRRGRTVHDKTVKKQYL